jgi:signal transduction histidine kinase
MRLADFILGNIEPILAEWEVFARGISTGATMNKLALRDHAANVLRAIAGDMMSTQTALQQSDKSKGMGHSGAASSSITDASEDHAIGRVDSGFDILQVVSEYRALRASVIHLWRDSGPLLHIPDLDDLTRFNEAVDQSLTKAVSSYTKRVDQSRQMFLAMLGHDLRGPLNAIIMSAGVISISGNDADANAECATQIRESGRAMARMINDLLDFTSTRLGTGLPVVPARIDLEPLCRDVLDECRAANPAGAMRFLSDGPSLVDGDADRLRQAISNLLGNAVQHGQTGGPIDLILRIDGAWAAVAVRNQGPPIPTAILATIFDPLVSGVSPETRRQRRPGSIGLGLYIAREVATAHGGRIDVTSSETGGTEFTLRLRRLS